MKPTMDLFVRNLVSKYLKEIKRHSVESLLKLLSGLEYTEAILEITAEKLFGNKFKWFIIFLTHLVKCVIRLQLLIIHKFSIQSLPSLFTLKNFLTGTASTKTNNQVLTPRRGIDKSTFTLEHSGRVVRTIKNSPANLETRDWVIPSKVEYVIDPLDTSVTNETATTESHFDATQDKQRYISEVLHIVRPLSHLTSLIIFDSSSWKQFMVPLLLDSLSLVLMNGTGGLSQSQISEMRRRKLLIMHYFIRSPFYDRYSSSIITILFCQIEQRFSGSQHLIGPLKSYIQQWRSIYNYCWSS